MEPDPSESALLGSLPPSRDENPWVVDRTPTRLDAEHAHRPLDPALVVSFKHAIRNETAKDAAYFDAATMALVGSGSAVMDVHYPATLAFGAPQTLPESVLGPLLDAYRTSVHPVMPFLAHVPAGYLQPTQLSGYLAYAMATMGSLAARPRDEAIAGSLWSRANALITASLELDNREARKPLLVTAWALLGTYGALCADEVSWRQTNICHGYVVTAARRLYRSPKAGVDWNAMPALLLADVLRSVHFGHPLTLSAIDCLSGPAQTRSAAIDAYASLMQGRPPSAELGSDEPLMVLVAILVDIHTYAHVIYPLDMAAPARASTASDATPNAHGDLPPPQSLFVPLSANNEARLARRKASKALALWATAYLEQSPRDWVVLHLFCQMYLSLPSIQALPVLAGYPPRLTCDGPATYQQQIAVDTELKLEPGAHRFAWQIVERVETLPDTIPSPWLPIAVFYAGLVIWRCSTLDLGSSTTGHGSKKVLLLFIEELRRMPWPCCIPMVRTLEALLY